MNTWKTRQVAGCAEQLIWKGFKYELQTEVAQRGRCQVNGSLNRGRCGLLNVLLLIIIYVFKMFSFKI